MTRGAASRPPRVNLASPVAQPPSWWHSARIVGPPARWIAPSTPPPPSSVVLAALTIASASCFVMSPCTSSRRVPAILRLFISLALIHRLLAQGASLDRPGGLEGCRRRRGSGRRAGHVAALPHRRRDRASRLAVAPVADLGGSEIERHTNIESGRE